jgi:CBS domain containing-hemolysin-like protein
MDVVLILLAILLLVLTQGFFSGSEMALVHADRLKLRHQAEQGHKGAKLVLQLFQEPEVLLGTTLVGTNLSVVAATTLGTMLMMRLFGEYGDLYAFFVFTLFFLAFGEVVPKSVYQQKANTLAPIVIYPLRFFSLMFYPVIFVFSRVGRLTARLAGVQMIHRDLFSTRDQIRTVIDMAEMGDEIDVFDRERIRRVVRLADTTVGQLMIPVTEMVTIHEEQSMKDAMRLVRKHGYFRLPVYKKNGREIIGIAALSMWKLMDPSSAERPLKDFIVPAYFVAPQQPVTDLLQLLGLRNDHMAIVVDEFGSAEGMITLEDIYEEVVGEAVNTGHDYEGQIPHHKFECKRIDDDVWLVDGRLPLAETDDLLDVKLPLAEAHTVGGLIIARLRHLPDPGESIVEAGFRFIVAEASESMIRKVRVERADHGVKTP